jgi:RNA polymerase sigma-70 factor, ECF subfamily
VGVDDLSRLILAAARGDRVALHAFVRTTQADVWRFCAHLVDRGAADDLTQEVYAQALRSLDRFRGEASGRTWLLAIARHVCADEIRRRQRRRPWEVLVGEIRVDRPGGTSAAVTEPDPSPATDLRDLVDQLDHDRRAAFVLTQMLGLTYHEAAETLGVPIGTVRSRVARARADLLAMLEPGRDASTA